MELDRFNFDTDYEQLGLDSLHWTALVTAIEGEFHTAFHDNLYDNFKTVNQFVDLLSKDKLAF
jgi:acyl carrier protein